MLPTMYLAANHPKNPSNSFFVVKEHKLLHRYANPLPPRGRVLLTLFGEGVRPDVEIRTRFKPKYVIFLPIFKPNYKAIS